MSENTGTYPGPDQLLPQSGEMNLLDELVEHTRDYSRCRFVVDPDHLLSRNDRLPAWFGIEYMGQCAFYHYQLNRYEDDEPTVDALFLGGRNITLNQNHLEPGQSYVVYAEDFGVNNRYYAARTHVHPEGQAENKIIRGRLSALILGEDESLLDTHSEQFT